MGLSEKFFQGRKVLIKLGDDHQASADARTPKPAPSAPGLNAVLAKQKHAESSTLFIGNLPFDVTEEELRDLVEGNAADAAEAEGEGEDDGDDNDGEDSDDDDDDDDTPAETNTHASSSRSGIKSGLIKTRVAQFEDTGRCKG